ncbi:MAG: MFS transporter [Fimbriimonadaceae bacterium]|nr:MFS transporter [Fimbriimonadaceae bacterium]
MVEWRRRRSVVLFFLSVLHMLCHALLSLLTPLIVAMQQDFGLPGVEPITALNTWLGVTFAGATLAFGALTDRAPGRLIAGWGLVVHGLGLLGLASANSLPQARLWLVIAGIGAAAYHPVAARQIPGLYPEAVGRAFGLVAIGAAVGFYGGPRFAGWRAELAGFQAPLWNAAAWRVPVWEAGLVAVLLAVVYLLATAEPELPQPAGGGAAIRGRDKAALVVAIAALGLLLIPRDFGGLGFESLNSLFLQRGAGFGLSVGAVGSLLGYKGLISLVSNPLFSHLSDRGQRLWWWAGTLVATALCGLLIPLLSPGPAQVALVLQGMFFLANFPIFEAALLERVPARLRGRAYALVLCIVGAFSAVAPKAVGGWVDALVQPGQALIARDAFAPLYWRLGCGLLSSLLAVPLLVVIQRRGRRLEG